MGADPLNKLKTCFKNGSDKFPEGWIFPASPVRVYRWRTVLFSLAVEFPAEPFDAPLSVFGNDCFAVFFVVILVPALQLVSVGGEQPVQRISNIPGSMKCLILSSRKNSKMIYRLMILKSFLTI